LTLPFFLRAAWGRQENRWRQIFELAWDNKGFVIDMRTLPDYVMDLFITWRNERIQEERDQVPSLPPL
jgi:hypothetical protein